MKNHKHGLIESLYNKNYFNKRVDTNLMGMLIYLCIYYQAIWDTTVKLYIKQQGML